jgi:hypothetical protein
VAVGGGYAGCHPAGHPARGPSRRPATRAAALVVTGRAAAAGTDEVFRLEIRERDLGKMRVPCLSPREAMGVFMEAAYGTHPEFAHA